MHRSRRHHRRLVALPLALLTVLALAACTDDGSDDAASPETSAVDASDDEQARVAAYHEVIDELYAVATAQWEERSSFPTTDAQFRRLAQRSAATLTASLEDPGPQSWEVATFRGDYGGNKGLIACTPDLVTVRLVVTDSGEAIGFGVVDGDAAAAFIYDPGKADEDELFDENGFFISSTECATEDTELDAIEKASRRGTF